MTEPRPWRVPVAVAQIPERGLRLELAADDATRAQLAATARLRGLPEATAEVMLTPAGGGKVQVSGRVRAVVGQTCVVTLEPVDTIVDEAFSVLFLPEEAVMPAAAAEDDDPPEQIVGGIIDVGSLVTDYLFLGIDPYPRKPGATFDAVASGPAPEDHPFAALKALKTAAQPGAAPDAAAEPPAPRRRRPPRKGS